MNSVTVFFVLNDGCLVSLSLDMKWSLHYSVKTELMTVILLCLLLVPTYSAVPTRDRPSQEPGLGQTSGEGPIRIKENK